MKVRIVDLHFFADLDAWLWMHLLHVFIWSYCFLAYLSSLSPGCALGKRFTVYGHECKAIQLALSKSILKYFGWIWPFLLSIPHPNWWSHTPTGQRKEDFFFPKAQTVGGLSFQGEASRDGVGRSRAENIKPGLNERIKTRSYGRAATSECHFSPRPARLLPFPRAALPLFHRWLPLRPTHTTPAGDLAVGQLAAVGSSQTVWNRQECGNVISVIPFPSHCAAPGIMPTACWENTSSLTTGVRLCSQSATTILPTPSPYLNPSF